MTEELDDTVLLPERPVATGGGPRRPSDPPDDEHTVIVPRSGDRAAGAIHAGRARRAAHYAFRVGRGSEAIPLDAPCLIGRRPSQPRIPSATPARLMRVASPLKEVSATHLEVRQVGASVVITDMKSTNGSIVMVPGSVPRKLRQGESVVVSPGTLVDIGDDNILQILPMQRPD